MITSLDRHLKNKDYKLSIIRDREFSSSKQVLDGKAKQLRLAGRGKRPNKARQLSEEEEEILWKNEKLGGKTPESLIHTMWWLLTQQFGLRGRQDRRSRNLRASGPFYLSIKHNSGPGDETWYKVQPMGENKINSMMKNIISQTTLQSSEKRFTNHSALKTLVSKMKKANLERSSIAKVTGHRNIQSLDDYDEADEDEQRQLSWAISKGNSTPKPVLVAGSSSGPCASNAVIPHMMNSQAQNLMNAFTNCTVTFNLNNKASPNKPRKRRFHFIESDSDTD